MTNINDELYHHGIPGMKWGVRRYQKRDGSLTPLGKKHKRSALKGLYEGEKEYSERAKRSKDAVDINKKSLKKSQEVDKRNGEESWNTKALKDAYIYSGRDYVNSTMHSRIYSEYIKAYENDTIKAGEDYVVKNFKTGAVALTSSGRAKESEIADRVSAQIKNEYAKEIKEYS